MGKQWKQWQTLFWGAPKSLEIVKGQGSLVCCNPWGRKELDTIERLSHADDTTVVAKSEDELKSLLMNVKEESEKVGLKLII